MSAIGKAFWQILAGILAWLLIAGAAAVVMLPQLPANAAQWAALVVLGPPAYLVFEFISSAIFSEERSERISKRSFSAARIAFGVLVAIPILAALWGLSMLFNRLA